ncbi:MAG TPA: hypothetical protein VF546_07845 [Pyrinomonadaceae bacterium]|jgi:hypothetical protein
MADELIVRRDLPETTLYRPVGTTELTLIRKSGFREFPPRLPDQPTFYPVFNESYATQIARDWNTRHSADGRGYVTRFRVRSQFLSKYKTRVVGGREHAELWIPAGELYLLNRNIVGLIEVIAEFSREE